MRKDELQTLPTSFRYVAALVSAMLVSSLPLPVLSESVELMVVDVHSVAEGYRASKLIGSSVVNDQNEKVGTIEDIIIGRDKVLNGLREYWQRQRRDQHRRNERRHITKARGQSFQFVLPHGASIFLVSGFQ